MPDSTTPRPASRVQNGSETAPNAPDCILSGTTKQDLLDTGDKRLGPYVGTIKHSLAASPDALKPTPELAAWLERQGALVVWCKHCGADRLAVERAHKRRIIDFAGRTTGWHTYSRLDCLECHRQVGRRQAPATRP